MPRFAVMAAALSFSVFCAAASDKAIKKVPITPTSPVSGQQMFNEYCTSCHGKGAKGNGPAASALKLAPPDLTNLAAQNKGKFPELRVYAAIQGDAEMPAHGSKDMPVWGSVFADAGHSAGEAQLRISNLVTYIKGLQTK